MSMTKDETSTIEMVELGEQINDSLECHWQWHLEADGPVTWIGHWLCGHSEFYCEKHKVAAENLTGVSCDDHWQLERIDPARWERL